MTPHLNILLFLFSTLLLSGQHNDVIYVQDFNKDEIDDRLECLRELGVSCTFTNGKTKQRIEWSNFVWKGDIKSVVTIPKKLLLEENKQIYKTMLQEVLPDFRKPVDSSLLWIINASFSKRILANNQYLDLVFFPKSDWTSNNSSIPSNYYVKMSRDSLYHLDPYLQKGPFNNKTTAEFGFLAYYGLVHFDNNSSNKKEFISVAKNSNYRIYKTRHGVLVQKKDKFKWLFITDSELTGGPEKLRWKSIEDVFLFDNYVLIKQSIAPSPEYQLYIVNINTSVVGRIKIDLDILLANDIEYLDLNTIQRLSIKNNIILIGNEIITLRFPVEEIKTTLDTFHN